jgi:hypothetical protein
MLTVSELAKQAFAATQKFPGFDAKGTALANQKPGIDPIGKPPLNVPKRPYADMPIPPTTAAPDPGQSPTPYQDSPIPPTTAVPDIGMPPTTYKDMPMPANAVLPDAGIPPFGTQGVGSMFKRMGQQATGTVADLGRRAATGFQTGMNQLQKADQLAGSYYPRIPRSSVPADGNYVKPETEAAFNSFNQEAARVAPPINRGKIISDRIQENLANASLQGRQQANSRVDANLARTAQLGRTLGGADYRQAARQGVVPQRGMGPLPSDAARKPPAPLGDGGAARRAADAAKARMRAGTTVWGAPTYTPAPELATAAGSSAPMTTSQLQFNRHKHNMANNPAYANRINAQRQQRTAQLERRNSFKLGGKPNGITS